MVGFLNFPRISRFLRSASAALLFLCALVSSAAAANIARPLVTTDNRALDGTIIVETTEFKFVFSDKFNGGISEFYDLSFDPGQTDNLATGGPNPGYGQGIIFDWDYYLGTDGSNANEFMTTMGANADPGALVFDLLESTLARVKILQSGHPRLNTDVGLPSDPFPELELIDFTTVWTIYPTGRVAVDFVSTVDPFRKIVDTGAGGAGKHLDAIGCCGSENIVTAGGGANFATTAVWPGDQVTSFSGGWGPLKVIARPDANTLVLESPVPAGTDGDYVIRRDNILLETLSIHADGDTGVVNQCSDIGIRRWEGGSDGDPLWSLDLGDPCYTLFREGPPAASVDQVLAHWTTDRGAGQMLAMFEPWATAQAGFYNDTGYTDISYTQLGQGGYRPPPDHARRFMGQVGSSASALLPEIKSVADALPMADDYIEPYLELPVGTLAQRESVATYGFDAGAGLYAVHAQCNELIARFDTSGSGRASTAYVDPGIEIANFFAEAAQTDVELSVDNGASYLPLGAGLYNLTDEDDAGQLGSGVRLFQYLGSVPATSTGAQAYRIRIAAPGLGCDGILLKSVCVKRLVAPEGDERLTVKSDRFDTTGAVYDPTAESVSLVLSAGDVRLWAAELPAGDAGWSSSAKRFKWKDKTSQTETNGLRKLGIGRSGPKVRVKVKTGDALIVGAGNVSTVTLEMRVGDDSWLGSLPCSTFSGKLRCR